MQVDGDGRSLGRSSAFDLQGCQGFLGLGKLGHGSSQPSGRRIDLGEQCGMLGIGLLVFLEGLRLAGDRRLQPFGMRPSGFDSRLDRFHLRL
jgi:hypothetical protein